MKNVQPRGSRGNPKRDESRVCECTNASKGCLDIPPCPPWLKPFVVILWAVIGLLSFAPAHADLRAFACEPEWKALLDDLGDGEVETYAATTAQQDTHHVEARPGLMAKVRRADLVVCTGAGLESGWLPMVLRQSGNARVQPGSAGGQAAYTPIESGLEALLEHYGVRIQRSYVLDENCYRQELPAQLGGGERPIYYAPLIKSQFIDQDRGFMPNIKGLVAVKASPLELLSERVSASNLKAWRLLASSEKSWEMKPPINLNPLTLRPPPRSDEVHSRPLAYLLEGAFPSFFAGKPLPLRTVENKTEGETPAPAPLSVDPGRIEHKDPFIATGKPGRIFVMATTEMLKDVVIDETGRGPNAVFALNVLDYLNGREDIAVMRAKEQRFNPLHDVSAGAKTFIKWFAIAGLPLLVALFGIGVWFRRSARKRRIQEMFASPA